MARYSKRKGNGVTAHYGSADEMAAANQQESDDSIRGFGFLIGLIGGGWWVWSLLMEHGASEWPKLARFLIVLISGLASGYALAAVSTYLVALGVLALGLGFIWLILSWLWDMI